MRNIITAEELLELGACEKGYNTFVEANGGSATYLEALDSNGLDDFLWYLQRIKLTERQEKDLRVFARQQALKYVDKIVDYCSDEEYNTILRWLQQGEDMEVAGIAARIATRAAARAKWKTLRPTEGDAVNAAGAVAWSTAEAAAMAAYSTTWSIARLTERSTAESDLKQIVAKW